MNIYFYFHFHIARDVVTVLLILVDIYQLNRTFSHTHIEARTHKHTCMSSAQDEWRETGTVAWFEGAKKRFW